MGIFQSTGCSRDSGAIARDGSDEHYRMCEFMNDFSGRVLDHGLGRQLEMKFLWNIVFDHVPRAAATCDGCSVMSTKSMQYWSAGHGSLCFAVRMS